MKTESKAKPVWTSLGSFSNIADLGGSIWFYAGSIEILTFEKDH